MRERFTFRVLMRVFFYLLAHATLAHLDAGYGMRGRGPKRKELQPSDAVRTR